MGEGGTFPFGLSRKARTSLKRGDSIERFSTSLYFNSILVQVRVTHMYKDAKYTAEDYQH